MARFKHLSLFRILPVLAPLVMLCVGTPAPAQGTDAEPAIIVRSTQAAGIPPLTFNLDAESTQKYALVIGNGDYEHVDDLPNAVNDARDIAAMLRQGGFVVSDHYNIGKMDFEAALRKMLFEVEPGAELFLFFAGHGVQIGSQNYLLPTDTQVQSVYDVPYSTVSLSSLMSLASSRARSLVAVLDACRDNPFPDQKGIILLDGTPASLKTGFSAQDTPINSLVVFSTSPGAVALDGVGDNSPFTTALLNATTELPDQPFNEILKEIRRDVYAMTGQRQVPWESSSLIEPVYLTRNALLAESGGAAPGAGRSGAPIQISSVLNRTVTLGQLLQGAGSGAKIALLDNPQSGRVELVTKTRATVLPQNAQISVPEANDIVYRPVTRQLMAVNLEGSPPIEDRFQVQINDEVRDVTVSMDIDECDIQAGDHLDPEGVGVTRFPNEIEPSQALQACLTAVARDPENGRFHYQLGRVYLALRDVEAAQKSFTTAERLGHTRALHGLGMSEIAKVAETAGARAGRAPDAALEFFKSGVEKGDPYAYHSLGLQYLRYPQTEDEPRQGFELMSRSLELGHTFSMNALGRYFMDQDAPHFDAERGLRYFQESAARKDIYGYANMGFVYLNGLGGMEQDAQKALDLFTQASDGGHPTAPSSIGRMYNSGAAPGGRDYAKAVEWYDVALSRGDAWGGANGAWIIANRQPGGFTLFDAAVRAAKAAALRNPQPAEEARSLLGQLNNSALDGGAQQLMADLGAEVTVDGAFGDQSQVALDALAADAGKDFPADRIDRLIALAKIHWERSKFRVDLY